VQYFVLALLLLPFYYTSITAKLFLRTKYLILPIFYEDLLYICKSVILFFIILHFISLLFYSIAMQPGTIISFGINKVLSYLILILTKRNHSDASFVWKGVGDGYWCSAGELKGNVVDMASSCGARHGVLANKSVSLFHTLRRRTLSPHVVGIQRQSSSHSHTDSKHNEKYCIDLVR